MSELAVLTLALIKTKYKILPHFNSDLEFIFLKMNFFQSVNISPTFDIEHYTECKTLHSSLYLIQFLKLLYFHYRLPRQKL